jgi:hypothetical protein
MKQESLEPKSPAASPRPCSTPHSAPIGWLKACPEPVEAAGEGEPPADPPAAERIASTAPVPSNVEGPHLASPFTRHDGWNGENMAIFCETLAETAVVAEACEAAHMGISGAYACRRRNPVFAAAWDAALTIARERLADTLLARSMEGNIELIWKDGVVVGERHLLDNRLGLAILRRLDRLAETGLSLHSNLSQPKPPAIVPRSKPYDWELAIDALRTGDEAAVCKALALVEGDKVEEVEDPLNRPPSPAEDPEEIDLSHRFWINENCDEKVWMTDFPPSRGFTGYQSCEYGDPDETYERECTAEEIAILEADAKRARDAERAREEALRDEWFAILHADCAAAEDEQCSPAGDGKRREEPRQKSSKSSRTPSQKL